MQGGGAWYTDRLLSMLYSRLGCLLPLLRDFARSTSILHTCSRKCATGFQQEIGGATVRCGKGLRAVHSSCYTADLVKPPHAADRTLIGIGSADAVFGCSVCSMTCLAASNNLAPLGCGGRL